MKTLLITIFTVLFAGIAAGQEQKTQFIRRGLLSADSRITPGWMPDGRANVYLNGNLEYFPSPKVSIRGDFNYMIGSRSDLPYKLDANHSLMLGAAFHAHTNNSFDPWFILQPGIAMTSSSREFPADEGHHYAAVLSPIGSAGAGFTYYFQRFAHLFVEARYIYGTHLSAAPEPMSLQEFRLSFGLGFNVFLLKKNPASAG